jgi:hypothetical protein
VSEPTLSMRVSAALKKIGSKLNCSNCEKKQRFFVSQSTWISDTWALKCSVCKAETLLNDTMVDLLNEMKEDAIAQWSLGGKEFDVARKEYLKSKVAT